MRKSWITIGVIIAVLILALILLNRGNGVSKETATCIANHSVLYTRLGCHYCELQEEMFGDSYQYLTIVDCLFNQEECIEKQITNTPTWFINNENYIGIQNIDKLKELTGCK